MANFGSYACFDAHAGGAQVVGEVFSGHMESIQQVGCGCFAWLPKPACDLPDAALKATVQPGYKAVLIEDRQHIIAPAALGFGLVDLPDVVKIEQLHYAAPVPQQAI